MSTDIDILDVGSTRAPPPRAAASGERCPGAAAVFDDALQQARSRRDGTKADATAEVSGGADADPRRDPPGSGATPPHAAAIHAMAVFRAATKPPAGDVARTDDPPAARRAPGSTRGVRARERTDAGEGSHEAGSHTAPRTGARQKPASHFLEAPGAEHGRPAPPQPAAHAPSEPGAVMSPLPARLPQRADTDGAVLRHAAHLRVAAPGLGELELHLRVRDGVAHLRVDGDAATAVEGRIADLSRALAGEGLKLGHLDVKAPAGTSLHAGDATTGDHRGGTRRDRDDAPPPPNAAPSPRTATTVDAPRPPRGSRFGIHA